MTSHKFVLKMINFLSFSFYRLISQFYYLISLLFHLHKPLSSIRATWSQKLPFILFSIVSAITMSLAWNKYSVNICLVRNEWNNEHEAGYWPSMFPWLRELENEVMMKTTYNDDNNIRCLCAHGSCKEVNVKVLTVEKVVYNNCKHIVFVCLSGIVLRKEAY